MKKVYIREANGEVLVMLDRHVGDRIHALEEAIKILNDEVILERVNIDSNVDRTA